MSSIALIGMMGSGKSSVAKQLSNLLNLPNFDSDTLITNQEKQSINEIFAAEGEVYFRDVEEKLIADFLNTYTDFILATGGGAFLNHNTQDALAKKCKIIYLETNPQTIYERLNGDTTRPLLQDLTLENITKILAKREKYYKKAHIVITTDGKNITDIAQEIVQKLT